MQLAHISTADHRMESSCKGTANPQWNAHAVHSNAPAFTYSDKTRKRSESYAGSAWGQAQRCTDQ